MPRFDSSALLYNRLLPALLSKLRHVSSMLLHFTLNGDPVEIALKAADRLLVDVLREDLALTGTKHGCGIGACGTCTVIIDGDPAASCLQLAALCEGSDIRTIEGLAGTHALHAVQQAFVNKSAFQCGICTPGHVMAACALLDKNPRPSDEEIRASADSVYCRCTGYYRIVDAYHEAVRLADHPLPDRSRSLNPSPEGRGRKAS